MSSRRPYGGVPADDRRRGRRAALLAAALDLIGDGGHRRLTVGGLCATARLNERYFYESFATLDDLTLAAYDEVLAEVGRSIVAAVAGAADDPRAKARAAIGAAVDLLADHPGKGRLVLVEARSVPVLAARHVDVARTFAALIVEQAQQFYGPAAARRTGSWAGFAAAHLLGGLSETLTTWARGELPVTRDELVDRSAELFVLVAEHVLARA